ncbi:TPA: TRADD-N-associated membrane domain-containing protein [Bacillus cereus]
MLSERKSLLEERKKELQQKLASKKSLNKINLSLGTVNTFLLAAFLYYSGGMIKDSVLGKSTEVILGLIAGGMLVVSIVNFLAPLRLSSNEYIIELQDIENELDLISISHSSLEARSEKLFKHHHLELKRYYDENLKQSSWIFFVGIACIVIGFVIIGVTLYFLIASRSNELENKIIVASVGAIGAILSNFIAVIYLKMHSEAVKALTEFHNRFVNTHHFYFSNFLLSKIQNEDKREDALVELALKINGIPPKSPAQGEENK